MTSETKELIEKYGIKMTIKPELTEKAKKIMAALENDPKIIESRKTVKNLNIN